MPCSCFSFSRYFEQIVLTLKTHIFNTNHQLRFKTKNKDTAFNKISE